MVSRGGESPTLDRRIALLLPVTRTVTTAAQTFRFTKAGFLIAAGEYSSNAFQVQMQGPDADGLEMPDVENFQSGHVITINGTDYTIDSVSTYDAFGQSPGPIYGFRFSHTKIDTDEITVTLLPGGEVVEVTIEAVPKWAGRRVLAPTDQLNLDNDQRLSINLARYVVRYDSRIKADQTLTDENGFARTILGIQPLDRRRYLDVLAERIS